MKPPTKKERSIFGLDLPEVLLALAGLIVVSGLLMEYGPEIRQDWVHRIKPSKPLIGGLLVIVGVFAEVLIGMLIARAAKREKRISDFQIAAAEDRIAKAEQATAEADLKRVRIEDALYRKRELSDGLRETLIRLLGAYAGQRRVDIFVYDHHLPEVVQFAASINAAFLAARWDSRFWYGSEPRISGSEIIFAIAREHSTGDASIPLATLTGALSFQLIIAGIPALAMPFGFTIAQQPLKSSLGPWVWDSADVATLRVQIGERQFQANET